MFADRPQGVRIPEQQLRGTDKGEPNTVKHVIPLALYAIQYFDENGQEHRTVVYKLGNDVYYDLNAERWASGLRQAASFVSKAVNEEHGALISPPTPTADPVDVLAVEESSGKASASPK